MSKREGFAFVITLVIIFTFVYWLAKAHPPQTVHATKADIVRWCLDHRSDPKSEHYYCEELHGYKYFFEGVVPNYDKYPSYKLDTQ